MTLRPSATFGAIPSRIPVLLAVMLAVAATPAAAVEDAHFAFETTRDLHRICAVDDNHPDHVAAQLACTAFIEATVQYHDAVTNREHLKPLACPPQGTRIADGKAAFVDWGRKQARNKRYMDELPVIGLMRALAATYPCQK